MISLLIAVPRSSVRAINAPVAGSAVSTANFRPAYEPARPASSPMAAISYISVGELTPVELTDAAAVRRERMGTTFGVVEQGVDPLGAAPVDQRLEVPGNVGSSAVGFGGQRQRRIMPPPYGVRAPAPPAADRRARPRAGAWPG